MEGRSSRSSATVSPLLRTTATACGSHSSIPRQGDFDLLVGADGLHSNVRRLVFGPEQVVEHHLGCKVAACVVDGYQPRDELVYLTYNAPGRQAARLRSAETARCSCSSSGPTAPARARRRKTSCARNSAMPGGSAHMLDAVDDAGEVYFDVVSQIRMDRWRRGRVVLIGDAAGCISLLGGEGTGLAMTEAYVLAGELDRAGGEYEQAFTAYEALMHPSSSPSRPARPVSSGSSPPARGLVCGCATG